MAEDWPRSETKSWPINVQKGTWPTYSHLDLTSLVNEEFIFVMAEFFPAGPTREIPSGPTLPAG